MIIIFSLLLTLNFSSNQNLEFWVRQLDNQSVDLRITACQKLKELRNRKSIPYLAKALQDRSSLVRYHAAISLGSHLHRQSLEALAKRFEIEEDAYVKGEIRRNMTQLRDFLSKHGSDE